MITAVEDDFFAAIPEAPPKQQKPYNPPPAWRCSSPVERARHLFKCFEGWAARDHCDEEGISDEDQRLAAMLAHQDRSDYSLRKIRFGDPAYGSWPSYSVETLAHCVNCAGYRGKPNRYASPDEKPCECELSRYQIQPRQLAPGDDPDTRCDCPDCVVSRKVVGQ